MDAVVCEAAPSYASESRLLREICQRSVHLAVFLFVEPEGEDYLQEQRSHGGFRVVRPDTPLEEFHRMLEEAIEKRQRLRAA
jgi:hypothetical protein